MAKFLRLALAAALFLCAGADRARAVTVHFAAELGKASEASMRPKAIDSGLTAAVSLVAARHTDAGQRVELSSQLKAIVSKARGYVTRYSVISEEVTDGVFKARYSAEVDRESLLSALEAAGFRVYRLNTPPRVLVASTPEPYSVIAAKAAATLFRAEGIEAAVYDQPAESQEALAKIAHAKGYHLSLVVTLASPPPPEAAADVQVVETPSPVAQPPTAEPVPVRAELACAATLYDARTGESLAHTEFATVAEAPDTETAMKEATERGSEELFEAVLGALVKSGWKIGDVSSLLTLRLTGLQSPALALEFSSLFSGLAEFRKVELASVEAQAVTWRVRAVNPGNDWLAVLSRVKPERGLVKWKEPGKPKDGAAPLLIEGQWLPR